MESISSPGAACFGVLRERLRILIKTRVSNGEFTERGLARMTGISQSQVHNILKGARGLSWDVADLMLAKLGISVLDLLTPDERSGNVPVFSAAMPKKPPTADLHRRFDDIRLVG